MSCLNCGMPSHETGESSSCPLCQTLEGLWVVFAPSHVSFVRAIDAEHAWKVAGEPKGARRVIYPAHWLRGKIQVDLPPEFLALLKDSKDGFEVFRQIVATPPDTVPEGMPPEHVTGLKVTPQMEPNLTGKSVIIVGCGVTRGHVDYYLDMAPEAEVWTMNDERHDWATRHFQVHIGPAFAKYGREFYDTSDLQIPVYTQENYPYGDIRRVWLNTTIDYMLAIADLDGFSHVYLPGGDFGGKRDNFEVDSARYWIGVIEGKGAVVYLSPLFTGFDCVLYGRS